MKNMLLPGNEDISELWKIVKLIIGKGQVSLILVLSHGQAKVERGFFVNEEYAFAKHEKGDSSWTKN